MPADRILLRSLWATAASLGVLAGAYTVVLRQVCVHDDKPQDAENIVYQAYCEGLSFQEARDRFEVWGRQGGAWSLAMAATVRERWAETWNANAAEEPRKPARPAHAYAQRHPTSGPHE